ncbi:MAG: MBL fold metallo-hydrolase [Theionarchaea archaeon]|nr:MAG: hypothetical protein AYK19_18830 [Theionarchaea archaeon DG-70-1]MBU7029067.1 MBL fold metallo-hydrolase [Theionarchaea archaeon]
MNVVLLAFDSMGVRSMCTLIEDEKTVLIDPGISLAPKRFGLPPHELELEQLMKKRDIINEYAEKADIITISHWHNDHHTPFITGLYKSVTPEVARLVYQQKVVLGKGLKGLNYMQKKRAHSFSKHQKYDPLDGTVFSFGGITVKGSLPVSHGTFTKIPVVMVSVEGEKKILHASDVQGFSGLQFVKEENPNILVMSGPPTYLLTPEDIQKAESNILELLDYCDQLILDHHHVRDIHFREKLPEVWKSSKVKTAAEYAGEPNVLLEAKRKELYSG